VRVASGDVERDGIVVADVLGERLAAVSVEDDHTPFVKRGVPSIDLIDFDFPCWHQTCDDITAVSKASLDKSGEAVLEFIRNR